MNLPPLNILDIDGESLRLLEDFTFFGITVPAGFICDGQSWCIGEKKAQRAAFLHDWLYFHNGKLPGVEKAYSRRDADALFRKALIATGVNPVRAWIRWTGVRSGGWVAWNKHKKRIKNEKATEPYSVGAFE